MRDGGPAFPNYDRDIGARSDGLTMRDYFAAQALAGYIAWSPHDDSGDQGSPEAMATFAYKCADAMLKAREQE